MKTCLPLFVNGFLLVYVLNYPKQMIDKLLVEGVMKVLKGFTVFYSCLFSL